MISRAETLIAFQDFNENNQIQMIWLQYVCYFLMTSCILLKNGC